MAKILSPIFIARRTLLSAQDGGADQQAELDWRLGQGQAVELFQSIAMIPQAVVSGVDNTSTQNASISLSLHRRTGTLTDPLAAAGIDELQYEILHEVTLRTYVTQVAAESTGVAAILDGPKMIDYRAVLGKPVLLGGNLTVLVSNLTTIAGTITYNHPGFALFYRYVLPTAKELTDAFFGRS